MDAARIDGLHPRRNHLVCSSVRDDKVTEVLASIGSSTGPASTGVDLCHGPWVVRIGPHNVPDLDHVGADRNERNGEDEGGNSPGGISGWGRALCLRHRRTLSPRATEVNSSVCVSHPIGSVPDHQYGEPLTGRWQRYAETATWSQPTSWGLTRSAESEALKQPLRRPRRRHCRGPREQGRPRSGCQRWQPHRLLPTWHSRSPRGRAH